MVIEHMLLGKIGAGGAVVVIMSVAVVGRGSAWAGFAIDGVTLFDISCCPVLCGTDASGLGMFAAFEGRVLPRSR